MTEREALKLALEALELSNANHWWGSSSIEKAITAIKEALMSGTDGAQPAVTESHKQEPVAWSITYHGSHCNNIKSSKELAEIEMERLEKKYGSAGRTLIPLYTKEQL